MSTHSRLPGIATIVLTLIGMGLLGRYLWFAITHGWVHGKLHAIHYAGSASYAVSIGAMVLGLIMGLGLLWMGWRWLQDPDSY